MSANVGNYVVSRKIRRNIGVKGSTQIIRAGTVCRIRFAKTPGNTDYLEIENPHGETGVIRTKKFDLFFVPPSVSTLERWSADGIAKSVMGKNVEPDGEDENGAPSWFRAMSLI